MTDLLLKILSLVVITMVKFIAGPLTGLAMKLPIWYCILGTFLGMMLAVLIFTYFGTWLRKLVLNLTFFNKNKVVFSPKSRNLVSTWRKYGIIGVAILTPIILTPIGGTLVAVSFGEDKNRIIFHMAWSAALWSLILNFSLYYLKAFWQ